MRLLLYLLVKLSAESLVIFRWFLPRKEARRERALRALQFGLLRLLLGRGVPLLLRDFSLQNLSEAFLLLSSVPVLWLQWTLIDALVAKENLMSWRVWFLPDRRHALARLGGVMVSLLVNVGAFVFGLLASELWV